MKKFLSLFLVMALMSTVSLVQAQTVYACEDYSAAGEPIGEGDTWTITSSGGSIYLLYNHGSRKGSAPAKVFYYIDKKAGGNYKEFATEPVSTAGKNWALLDYKFMEAGDYRIGVYTEEEKLLAETTITVNLKSSTGSTTTTTGNGSSASDYYASSKIVFCEDVVSNVPKNAASSFIIGKSGGYLQVQVDNGGKALKTKEMVVKVYRKAPGGKDYDEFVEKLSFPIEEHWDKPYFKYDFLKTGDYVFDIYTANDIFINSGYVTIKYK